MSAGAKLFVGCLPYSKTEADLVQLFSQYGAIAETHVLKQQDGSPKGAAFVTYQHPQSAQQAMAILQGYMFEGSNRGINISLAGAGGQSAPANKGGGKGFGKQQQMQQVWQQPQQFMNPYPQNYQKQQQWQQSQFASQPSPSGAKVFVGMLPYSKSEADLMQLFSSIGPVAEVKLLRNPATNEKKGAALVMFTSPQHAQAAVSALDGFVFTGSPRPITVSRATSSGGQGKQQSPSPMGGMGGMGPAAGWAAGMKRQWGARPGGGAQNIQSLGQQAPTAMQLTGTNDEGTKVFVGKLPFSKNEADIAEAFGKFGLVAEVYLHKDAQGQKKGGAFVRFYTADHAVQALEMDGFLFPGATRPITVAPAVKNDGAKKQRLA